MIDLWQEIEALHRKRIVGILHDWKLIDCSTMPARQADLMYKLYGHDVMPMFALGLCDHKYRYDFMPMPLRRTSLLRSFCLQGMYIVTLNSVYLLAGAGIIEKGKIPDLSQADRISADLAGIVNTRLKKPNPTRH